MLVDVIVVVIVVAILSERADNWPPPGAFGQRDWRRLLSYKSHSINHIQGINYIFIFCCAFLLNVNRRQTAEQGKWDGSENKTERERERERELTN